MADTVDYLESLVHGVLADHLNTHLEGRIVAYRNGRVDVQPTGTKNYPDGDSMPFPVLHNLKLNWLAGDGGKAGVKIPVKVGDGCLIMFRQQPQVDQDTDDNIRRFSLADATVLPGLPADDALPGNDNVAVYYGPASLQITPAGKVKIIAPGGFEVESPSFNYAQAGGGAGAVSFKGMLTTDQATINGRNFMSHTHKEQGDGNNVSGVI